MYLQWIAAEQWTEARRLAGRSRIFGDLPFMISGNSADVWLRQVSSASMRPSARRQMRLPRTARTGACHPGDGG